jgi:FkbM family methyltransferase
MKSGNNSTLIQSFLHQTERLGGYIGRAASRELRLRYTAIVQAEFGLRLAALRPGDITLDLGANVGIYTKKLAATGALVHAFEPDPATFERLTDEVGHLPNVVLHQKAIGAKDGLVHLARVRPNPRSRLDPSLGSSVVFRSGRMNVADTIAVEQIGFKNLLDGFDRDVALIKMDIEGAEVEILEDIVSRGLKHARFSSLFVETHEWQEPTLHRRIMGVRTALEGVKIPYFNLYWH